MGKLILIHLKIELLKNSPLDKYLNVCKQMIHVKANWDCNIAIHEII